jgi:endonuclease YncB( thermonuclease family)/DNA/RNA endonuclease YhcR with UshA esterase domain
MKNNSITKGISLLLIFALIVSNFSSVFAISVNAEEKVISVSEAIANNHGTAIVEGYIVGTTKSSTSDDLEPPFDSATNLVIADSPDETDISKRLPVQLPSGSIRSALNLVDNPGNYLAKIQIEGNLEAYFTRPGLKSPTTYVILEGGQAPESPKEPELTSISEVREMGKGTEVIIQGIVIADNAAIGGGRLSTYIQDATAGINVYSNTSGFPDLVAGQKVEVHGKIEEYRGLLEVIPTTDGITVLEEKVDLPEPTPITIAQLQDEAIAEPLEGSLVNVTGYVKMVPSSLAGGGYNVSFIDKDFNSTTLRVMEGTGAIDELKEEKWYDVTAILSQYDTYQILPRKASDISVSEEQPEPPSAAGEYMSTVASVTDGDTIKLKTPVLGATTVRYVNIDTPETYHAINNDLDQNQKDHGDAATDYMKTLLKEGDEVVVKVGEEATDAYGRLLAQIIRKSDGLNTNLEMVKKGYASTYFIWPVGSEADYNMFQSAVAKAKGEGLGIWDLDDPLIELPFEFRARYDGKGLLRYVGNSDTKEYVEPEHFADVPVDKRVFFASEVEAEENGYIPACANMEPPPEDLEAFVEFIKRYDKPVEYVSEGRIREEESAEDIIEGKRVLSVAEALKANDDKPIHSFEAIKHWGSINYY